MPWFRRRRVVHNRIGAGVADGREWTEAETLRKKAGILHWEDGLCWVWSCRRSRAGTRSSIRIHLDHGDAEGLAQQEAKLYANYVAKLSWRDGAVERNGQRTNANDPAPGIADQWVVGISLLRVQKEA